LIWLIVSEYSVHHGRWGSGGVEQLTSWWPEGESKSVRAGAGVKVSFHWLSPFLLFTSSGPPTYGMVLPTLGTGLPT
jgi:hypothetical protein